MKAQSVQTDNERDICVPDVWWGQDGIDGLLWADPPPPYAEPLTVEASEPLELEATR